MYFLPVCTVAQLLFKNVPAINFARMVADLEAAFRNCPVEGRSLTWDHDDLAILDLQASRIIIGFETGVEGEYSASLCVGVGPGPGRGEPGLAQRQDTVSRLIVDRITQRFPADLTLWHQSPKPLAAELLDDLVEALPRTLAAIARREETKRESMEKMRQSLAARKIHLAAAANDQPDLPQANIEELARVRSALYDPVETERPSAALRLAAHAMNATMVCIALPVGAAVMTYSLLRGENLNASARILAMIGIAIGARDTAVARDLMPWI